MQPLYHLQEDELLDTVFHEIQFHIKTVLDVKKILDQMDEAPSREIEIRKLDEHIQKKKEEAWKAEKLKSGIYEDLKDGILDKKEYQNLKMEFNRRMEEAEEAMESAVAKVEPAMVLIASALVGVILLAVMLPLMNIMAVIG